MSALSYKVSNVFNVSIGEPTIYYCSIFQLFFKFITKIAHKKPCPALSDFTIKRGVPRRIGRQKVGAG